MQRIAVIGAGIAGLAAARALCASASARVTLFEASHRFGGHARTVDLTLEGRTHGIDTGFLVYNEVTYPRLSRLFAQLGVTTAESEMSFSVQRRDSGLEWSGRSLGALFAQPTLLASPRFMGMLAQILRFNRLATGLAERGLDAELAQTVGDFLEAHGFGAGLRDDYLLPMVACIWSCPVQQMLQFPIGTLVRFCHNHGLLRLRRRPQWRTVSGGSREYVRRIVSSLPDARHGTPVRAVLRTPAGALVKSDAASEHFDGVVFACHSTQALRLLGDDASADERRVLGAIGWQRNRTVLHTDASVLPRRRRAWSAWNHEAAASGGDTAVCLHYLINRLQPLPWRTPVIVSLNPLREPAGVLDETEVEHPVFDMRAVAAQRELASLQGRRRTWFCGAWTGHGFHEDGLASGLHVADQVARQVPLREAATA